MFVKSASVFSATFSKIKKKLVLLFKQEYVAILLQRERDRRSIVAGGTLFPTVTSTVVGLNLSRLCDSVS